MKRRDFLAGSSFALGVPAALRSQGGGTAINGKAAVKFLFMDGADIHNAWGHLRFSASKMARIADAPKQFTVKYCLKRPGGGYDVWGFQGADHKPWKLYRAHTADGMRFENIRVVLEGAGSDWAHTCSVSYSPELQRFLFLKNRNTRDGFSIFAFSSSDGEHWKEYDRNPVFEEGDRWGALWSPAIQRFVYYGKGIQRFEKRIPELFANARRVITLRTSADGFHWIPDSPALYRRGEVSAPEKHGGSRLVSGPLVPVEYQLSPDELDPPDLEFYAGDGFVYEDRYYLLMLNYAASPVPPGTPPVGADGHGPALDTEWWISRNGRDWARPFRGIDAGRAFINHNPMIFSERLLFHDDSDIWSVPQHRITWVTARTNGIFDTAQFRSSGGALWLNARVPGEGYSNYQNQGYIMAELVDDLDRVIPGYEKERCLFQAPLDSPRIPLRWHERDGSELHGRNIRVRIHLRGADVFAITA